MYFRLPARTFGEAPSLAWKEVPYQSHRPPVTWRRGAEPEVCGFDGEPSRLTLSRPDTGLYGRPQT